MNKHARTRIIKIIALALAVLAQVAIIVFPYMFFRDYLVHLNWILEIISFIAVIFIIESDINPSYKIPWIVILLVVPVFGGILFLIYGRTNSGKKEFNRATNMMKICQESVKLRQNYNDELRMEHHNVAVQADYLFKCADALAYKNTQTTYFPLGDDAFPVMLRELKEAKKFIFMEYFIVEEGVMLNPIIDILEEKVKNGVEVRFVYDSFGSMLKTPVDFIKKLQRKGIICFEYNSFRTILDSRYNNRDHRKICVIDGNTGFTGGINLADEYINRKTVYGHWKDTAIMIKGEAVWSLTSQFLSLWDATKSIKEDVMKYIPTKILHTSNGYVIPYADYPLDDEPVGKNVYMNIINRADEYVYIMTPYLILDNVLTSSLINAAKNGIDVRIIIPGIPDKKIVYMLTESYAYRLIKNGVKVYKYTPGFIHAKVFLSDDRTAVVGTINLDYRSLTHHLENGIWMYDTSCVYDIKKDFADTFEKSELLEYVEYKKRSFIYKILLPVLKLFSPLF